MFRLRHGFWICSAASIVFAAAVACCNSDFLAAAEPPATAPENTEPPLPSGRVGQKHRSQAGCFLWEGRKTAARSVSAQGVQNAPVVVFVHGGEWSRHDKAEVSYKPKFLNEHGIVLASINYRLSPPAKHPDHVEDVAAAVRWLRRTTPRNSAAIRGKSSSWGTPPAAIS